MAFLDDLRATLEDSEKETAIKTKIFLPIFGYRYSEPLVLSHKKNEQVYMAAINTLGLMVHKEIYERHMEGRTQSFAERFQAVLHKNLRYIVKKDYDIAPNKIELREELDFNESKKIIISIGHNVNPMLFYYNLYLAGLIHYINSVTGTKLYENIEQQVEEYFNGS